MYVCSIPDSFMHVSLFHPGAWGRGAWLIHMRAENTAILQLLLSET
jgi:hypothetical protein